MCVGSPKHDCFTYNPLLDAWNLTPRAPHGAIGNLPASSIHPDLGLIITGIFTESTSDGEVFENDFPGPLDGRLLDGHCQILSDNVSASSEYGTYISLYTLIGHVAGVSGKARRGLGCGEEGLEAAAGHAE